MSLADRVDPVTRSILRRHRFDEATFERLRGRVAAGELSAAANIVRGQVDPLEPGDASRLPEPGAPGHDEARRAGVAAFRRSEVAVAILNGGMATRFGGRVKGVLEAVEGRSFLEWKLRDAGEAGAAAGGTIPLVVMNSFATDEAARAHVADRGLSEPIWFTQSVSLRLEPDGRLFTTAAGAASPYSPGHGDFLDAVRASGTLAELRRRGVRTLMLSNVDNLGARPDPVVAGSHLLAGRPLTVEVARKAPGDVGGAPARVDGRPVLVEGFRFPPEVDQEALPLFGTNSLLVELEALQRDYPLTWLYVEKRVEGRRAVQLERLVHELSAFVATTYLEVPRDGDRARFVPVKTPADLEAARRPLSELLRRPLLA